jgi:hypothetical protein
VTIASASARRSRASSALDAHQFPPGRHRLLCVLDRDAAAPGADHDAPTLEEPLERLEPEDALRQRRGHDAAEAFAVGLEHPALILGEPLGVLLRVDRPDRLRRIGEGGVVGVDLHQREKRRETLLERQLVPELLLDQVADHPLRLGSEQVERVRVDLGVGGALQREEPDLRPVAVGDDELVVERKGRERLARDARVRALVLRRQRLAAPEQRVAAERDDDAHLSSRSWRP